MAVRHPKRSPDQRKWLELAEYPGLQPEDLAPDPRRLTYDPGLRNAPEFEIFLRLATDVRSMAPWPVEIVPQGTPDPSAERRRRWSADILEAWSRGKIELGARAGLIGPIRPIASRLSDTERVIFDPRSGRLTIWLGSKQQPLMWFGVVWRRAILDQKAQPERDIVMELVEFQRALGRTKAATALEQASAHFKDENGNLTFTKRQWEASRRELQSEHKLSRGKRK